MRGWIMTVTMDKEDNYVSMERFMPSYRFSNPMDMEFAANGDLYMLEYGSGWFTANDDARLIRIEYNGGNRKPQVLMAANQMGGAVPFDLKLSSKGTTDADYDDIKYTWNITSEAGFDKTINASEANLTLSDIGVYKITLTADDGQGGIVNQNMEVVAGNEPPVLSLEMPNSNKSFYIPNGFFEYDIKVNDKEDGSLNNGIDAQEVAVTIDYLAEGFDQIKIAQGHRSADALAEVSVGKKLMDGSDCMACHKNKEKSIGPSYMDIAMKYIDDGAAPEYLSKKIISGGGGVWGEIPMAAHPQLSAKEAAAISKYILDMSKPKLKENALPTKGIFQAKVAEGDQGKGIYIVRAAYEDRGANNMPSLQAEESFMLRSSKLGAHDMDEYVDVNKMSFGGNKLAIPTKSGAYLVLKQIDLSGLSSIEFLATAPKPQLNAAGGKIEVRLGGPQGTLIGASNFLEASETMGFTPSLLVAPLSVPNNLDGKPQDLCLVFVNENSGESQSLMVVLGAELKMTN
jgi:cytochrome c